MHERMLQRRVLDVILNGFRLVIGDDISLSQNQKVRAHLFHNLKYVRTIENRSAFVPQRLDQILQDKRGCHIETGEGLIKYQYLRVVHEGGNEQNALTHSLRVGAHRAMPVGTEREQIEEGVNLVLQPRTRHPA